MLDSLLDNSLLLPAAGVLVALLGGFGLYRLRGRMRKPAGETSFLESRLQPDSFFGASGGQRVDTHEPQTSTTGSSSSMSYSLSQLDAIGDVDPVAEADVYLAYGRDLQAEEILKEAMRANPERMAIRSKLLEVYAKRRDTKAFELLATQMLTLTRGEGEDWPKAQALGLSIDPENPLYKTGAGPVGGSGEKPTRRSKCWALRHNPIPRRSRRRPSSRLQTPRWMAATWISIWNCRCRRHGTHRAHVRAGRKHATLCHDGSQSAHRHAGLQPGRDRPEDHPGPPAQARSRGTDGGPAPARQGR
jgi:hypothetical protein